MRAEFASWPSGPVSGRIVSNHQLTVAATGTARRAEKPSPAGALHDAHIFVVLNGCLAIIGTGEAEQRGRRTHPRRINAPSWIVTAPPCEHAYISLAPVGHLQHLSKRCYRRCNQVLHSEHLILNGAEPGWPRRGARSDLQTMTRRKFGYTFSLSPMIESDPIGLPLRFNTRPG